MNLPPLTALKYFNVAARYQNFKKAAAELCVSEGAVSRQIKLLEDYYGKKLFERLHQGVKLSREGHNLYSISDIAFKNISQISNQIMNQSPSLNVSVSTSFAIRWLMPKLSLFEETHPELSVNLQTIRGDELSSSMNFDVSIVYRLGNPNENKEKDNENKELLLVEWLMPVSSPNFLQNQEPIDLSNLKDHRLIFNNPSGSDWIAWMKLMKISKKNMNTPLKLEHDDTAIQAAVAGHGIALANLAYISEELKNGTLIKAVDCEPQPIGAHYLISQSDETDNSNVKKFTNWILKLAAEDYS